MWWGNRGVKVKWSICSVVARLMKKRGLANVPIPRWERVPEGG